MGGVWGCHGGVRGLSFWSLRGVLGMSDAVMIMHIPVKQGQMFPISGFLGAVCR